MMKKLAIAALVFVLGSVTALAADFNGKWTADVPGRQGETQTITFDLHVDGSTLTGKISTPRGDMDISNGKVDGDTITFDEVRNFNGHSVTINYLGTADGDSIQFTRSFSGGGHGGHGGHGGNRGPQQFTAKRAATATTVPTN